MMSGRAAALSPWGLHCKRPAQSPHIMCYGVLHRRGQHYGPQAVMGKTVCVIPSCCAVARCIAQGTNLRSGLLLNPVHRHEQMFRVRTLTNVHRTQTWTRYLMISTLNPNLRNAKHWAPDCIMPGRGSALGLDRLRLGQDLIPGRLYLQETWCIYIYNNIYIYIYIII